MFSRIAADALVVLHGLFIVFVVAGGFMVWRWHRLAWAHLPAAGWGAAVELMDWVCPLTPLENALRRRAGDAGYEGGFIEHYLIPLIYPPGLTTGMRIALGLAVLLLNGVAYGVYFTRRGRHQNQ